MKNGNCFIFIFLTTNKPLSFCIFLRHLSFIFYELTLCDLWPFFYRIIGLSILICITHLQSREISSSDTCCKYFFLLAFQLTCVTFWSTGCFPQKIPMLSFIHSMTTKFLCFLYTQGIRISKGSACVIPFVTKKSGKSWLSNSAHTSCLRCEHFSGEHRSTRKRVFSPNASQMCSTRNGHFGQIVFRNTGSLPRWPLFSLILRSDITESDWRNWWVVVFFLNMNRISNNYSLRKAFGGIGYLKKSF